MHARLTTVCLAFILVMPAIAQETPRTPAKAPETDRVLHVTDRLSRMPEAMRALQDFHARKTTGKTTAVTPLPKYTVGMAATFKVLNNLATSPTWVTKEFELKASSDIANIWVEVEELAMSHVDDTDVATLEEALLVATPDGSIDPTQGIVANNNAYFGAPPDVDGDGRLDILLYNIVEGSGQDNLYIAGYVTSSDLSQFGGGNHKDVLYLDTDPGITTRPIDELLGTAAHEYQHLIHYNYDLNELTFVNEGLSEWAEVLNGYLPRPMTQLQNPALYNIGLLSWEGSANILDDYRRAGLYTAYLAERLGPDATASITRQSTRGRTGYEAVTGPAGLDFELVLQDYHTANFLNIPKIEPRFGYDHPDYAAIAAVPSALTDGRGTQSTPETFFSVAPGAAQYYVWTDVQNFVLDLDTSDPNTTIRERMQVRVVSEATDGSYTYHDLDLPLTDRLFAGSHARLIVQSTHVRPELTASVGLELAATWSTDLTGSIVSTVYDDGSAVTGTFFSLSSAADGAVATRFEVPERGRLLEVGLSPYYLNQFSGTGLGTGEPRDIELRLWDVAPNGAPGMVLFSKEIDDPRAYAGAQLGLSHFTIDLDGDAAALDELPESIFIGYAEAGEDANYMVVGASAYTAENRSYVRRDDGSWGALWDVQFQDGGEDEFPLRGTVIPVRATFFVASEPVANEDDAVGPTATTLGPNYPNPFFGATTLPFELGHAARVKLTIYDVLGRAVRTLVDADLPPGPYRMTLDAEGLPGGTYFYTLDVGGYTQTRRMVRLK
jgi:hypothetical protein